MNDTQTDVERLDQTHRTIHRSTLFLLALAAVAALAAGLPDVEPVPDVETTMLALGLGAGCIVLRRFSSSPVIAPRTEMMLGIAGLACGACLGLLGAGLAWQAGAGRTGLAYAAAGFIFCIRAPAPLHARVRRHELE
jgi:hypothetical protein